MGTRRITAFAIRWGLLIGLTGGVCVGLDVINRRGFININGYKPVGLLLSEAAVLDENRAGMAAEEVASRGQLGQLTAGEDAELLDVCLARHARAWQSLPQSQWDVIMNAHSMDLIEDERLAEFFDDCGGEILIDSFGKFDNPAYPGETITLKAEIDWRAGATPAGSFSLLMCNMSTYLLLKRDDTKHKLPALNSVGFVSIERAELPAKATNQAVMPLAYDLAAGFNLPDDLEPGTYEATIVCNTSIMGQGPTFDPDTGELVLPEPISKEITRTLTLSVVETGSLDPLRVTPADFPAVSDPTELINYEGVDVEYRDGTPVHTYHIQRGSKLPQDTGFSGLLVFSQGNRELRSIQSVYAYKHKVTRGTAQYGLTSGYTYGAEVHLHNFEPGEVLVRYEMYPGLTRNYRHLMDRVLAGPIELGSLVIPDPPKADIAQPESEGNE